MTRSAYIRLSFGVLSILVTLCLGELILRFALSTDIALLSFLKKADVYFNEHTDEDFWKLHYKWTKRWPPPSSPHPVLGWHGDYDPKTFLHNDAVKIRQKRPVLLYGDSFAECTSDVRCFENILNTHPHFSQNYHLLNYGTGGFGVGQIFLSFENSWKLYKDPLIIFSLMTYDLDRTGLAFRIGQKPYFKRVGEELHVGGYPIYSDPQEYLRKNPIRIFSYLYNLFIHYRRFPEGFRDFLQGNKKQQEELTDINQALLNRVIEITKKNNLPLTFLIFHPEPSIRGDADWRDTMLRDFFRGQEVAVLFSNDIIGEGVELKGSNAYIIPGDSHPTSLYNEEVSAALLSADTFQDLKPG